MAMSKSGLAMTVPQLRERIRERGRKKDDLEQAAEEVRVKRRPLLGVFGGSSNFETDDRIHEGAGGDGMREEALDMMNRGSLRAEIREPDFDARKQERVEGVLRQRRLRASEAERRRARRG
jgi:hypothetical protein